jgi:hypothetical protein
VGLNRSKYVGFDRMRREYQIKELRINGKVINKVIIDEHVDKHVDHIDDSLV